MCSDTRVAGQIDAVCCRNIAKVGS